MDRIYVLFRITNFSQKSGLFGHSVDGRMCTDSFFYKSISFITLLSLLPFINSDWIMYRLFICYISNLPIFFHRSKDCRNKTLQPNFLFLKIFIHVFYTVKCSFATFSYLHAYFKLACHSKQNYYHVIAVNMK